MAGGFILLMSTAVLYDSMMMMMMMIIVGIVFAGHHIRYTDLQYSVYKPLNFATIHFWSLLK